MHKTMLWLGCKKNRECTSAKEGECTSAKESGAKDTGLSRYSSSTCCDGREKGQVVGKSTAAGKG